MCINWKDSAGGRPDPYYEDSSDTEANAAVVIVSSIACRLYDLLTGLAQGQMECVVDRSHGRLGVGSRLEGSRERREARSEEE